MTGGIFLPAEHGYLQHVENSMCGLVQELVESRAYDGVRPGNPDRQIPRCRVLQKFRQQLITNRNDLITVPSIFDAVATGNL